MKARAGILGAAFLLLSLLLSDTLTGQEKLKASRIQARSGRHMVRLGLPLRNTHTEHLVNALANPDFAERVIVRNKVWISENGESPVPNWVCWDVDHTLIGKERDRFLGNLPSDKVGIAPSLWSAFLTEMYKWAWEKPYGELCVVCGPIITADRMKEGKDAVPNAFYAVMCKKVSDPRSLGWKSIGFLFPNVPLKESLSWNLYSFSCSVNSIEHKSGYDFFPKLPSHLQERIEEMTTYELFSTFVEDEGYDPVNEFQSILDSFDMDALEYLRPDM